MRASTKHWLQQTIVPRANWLTTKSAEHTGAITSTGVGLAAASLLLFPPLKLLIAPTLLLAALPAYRTTLETWQAEEKINQKATDVVLAIAFIASNQLLLGAIGTWLLAATEQATKKSAETDRAIVPATVALSFLAYPIAGISGSLGALYAASGYGALQPVVPSQTNQHTVIRNLPAALRLPTVNMMLIDQSCLVETQIDSVQSYQHHAPEEVVFFAAMSKAISPQMQGQLRKYCPGLEFDTIGIDVQLKNIVQTGFTEDAHYAADTQTVQVVVAGRPIGTLNLVQTPAPQARLLLHALRQFDCHIHLLSSLSERQTAKLAHAFDIDDYAANLTENDKFFHQQMCSQNGNSVCFIGRDAEETTNLTLSLSHNITPDVTLHEGSLPTLLEYVTEQKQSLSQHQRMRSVPIAITTGGIFFLHWGLPTAVLVQAVGLIGYSLFTRNRSAANWPLTVKLSERLA